MGTGRRRQLSGTARSSSPTRCGRAFYTSPGPAVPTPLICAAADPPLPESPECLFRTNQTRHCQTPCPFSYIPPPCSSSAGALHRNSAGTTTRPCSKLRPAGHMHSRIIKV